MIQSDFCLGVDAIGLQAGITENHGKRHGETAGVGRADQLFRVGAPTALEARLEAIGSFPEHAGFCGNRADAGFQITFPMGRCFLNDSHACLLKIGAKRRAFVVFTCQGCEDRQWRKVHLARSVCFFRGIFYRAIETRVYAHIA
ncbi:hypothetical protein D9M69_506490 [compost metagenome]